MFLAEDVAGCHSCKHYILPGIGERFSAKRTAFVIETQDNGFILSNVLLDGILTFME